MKHPTIVGKFTTGNSVTITIKDVTSPASPITVVNAVSCTEIGSTGYFAYNANLDVDTKTYLVTMTNGSTELAGTLSNQSAPTAAEVDSQLSSSHGSGNWVPPTVSEIEAELAEEHGSGSWEKDSSGLETYTDDIIDENVDPIEGVKVIAYSDSDRTTVADKTLTDVNGVFVLHLDPGTYYMRAKKAEFSFDDWIKVIS